MITGIGSQGKKRLTRKRVYISGPLTSSGEPQENMWRAIDAMRALIDMGFAPLCPHLTLVVDPDARIKHSVWMEIDLPWVSVSDAILRLPGPSSGADQECREAFERGIPIFHSLAELAKEMGP